MTTFELLGYVVTFTIVLCLIVSLVVSIKMLIERNKFVKDYKERKEKQHEIKL